MQESITSQNSDYNSRPTVVNRLTTLKRTWLTTQKEKDLAYEKKRAWILAASKECMLRLNEPTVLEALAFLTDHVTGIGKPSIGAIQEAIAKTKTGYLSYCTVQTILKRLEVKGAIKSQARHNKTPGKFKDSNIYVLIGYEYKLANHSLDSMNSLNLSPLTGRERDQEREKESDSARASPAEPPKEEEKAPLEVGLEALKKAREILERDRQQNPERFSRN